MEQIAMFILFGFIVLFMLAWVWAIWRWSSDALHGLKRGATMDTNLRIIAWAALYALLALIPLFIAAVFWNDLMAVMPS
jgi:hypothetical protein